MKTALSMLAALGLAASAASAQTFTLVSTQNFDLLMDDPTGNDSFWIGNNPSAIAFDGVNLYIAGFCNGTCPWVQIVKVEDVLGTRQFRAMIDQSDPLNPNQDPNISSRRVPGPSRGISGIDFVEGAGLVMTADLGGFGPIGQVMTWDVETQQNPIPLQTSPAGESPRGVAGPSWDFGYNGGGFTWDFGGGDAGTDDPVVAVVDFTSDPAGPLGLSPNTLSAAFGATVYEPSTGGPEIDDGMSGTIWRDIDIDPATGNIAARAANDLVIARRAPDGTVASSVVVDGGNFPFVVGQNVNILHGACGDLVIYNDRPDSSTRSFASSVRVVDLDGNPVAVAFENADGTTFSPVDGVGYYDYAWHQPTGILAIMDFASRNVHFFELSSCGGDPCDFADCDGNGVVDTRDFSCFFNQWVPKDSAADCDGNGVIDTRDVTCFLNLWNSCR